MQALKYIKYGSAKKTVLYYLKMKDSPVSFMCIYSFVKHYQQRPFRIKEGLIAMQRDGLVEQIGKESWKITPLGIKAVYELGKRDSDREKSRF
jgi:hypothetical protein